MNTETDFTKKDRIIFDLKEIRKKVRREGFRDTTVEESKPRKKDKHKPKLVNNY